MEADDLLCSRNAREGKGSLAILLLAERARSECARSTRAFEDRPAHPLKEEQASLEGTLLRAVEDQSAPISGEVKSELEGGGAARLSFLLAERAGARLSG